MKKHVYLFFAPMSPLVKYWSVSGVSCDESKEGDQPVALTQSQLLELVHAEVIVGVVSPVIRFEHLWHRLTNLCFDDKQRPVITPSERGGLVVDFYAELADAE